MNSTAQFNIGEAAARSGVSAKMVRHYESLGLLPTVVRTDAGYRRYGDQEVHTLRFIRRARDLGFSMVEITQLLKLWQNRRRASADVKRIALLHVADLERRMAAMAQMRDSLQHLAHCCQGDQRPHCPILDALSGDEAATAVAAPHALKRRPARRTAEKSPAR
jgi:MerR family transcriptional regulator, copper efflux regulator